MSRAAYYREYRARKKTGDTRPPGRPATAPCGTVAAYARHKYNGEEPDEACVEANREHQRKMYQQRKARQG